MVRRILGPAFAGVVALSMSACDSSAKPSASVAAKPVTEGPISVAAAEIGEPLFPPVNVTPRPATAAVAAIDPIIVRQCQVTLAELQNVPSKNSGRLLYLCTDILPGEAMPSADQIIEHPRTKVKYRRLKEGDSIKKGQLIGFLDDKLAAAKKSIEVATITANEAKEKAAERVREAAQEEYVMYYNLQKKGGAAEAEVRRTKAQMHKAEADVEDARGQLLKSREDFQMAQVVLEEHEVRSTIPGKINRFFRRAGESIKELDPVAEVQNLDRVRVEGLLEVQYLPQLDQMRAAGRPVKVVIESSPQTGPTQQLNGHLQPVRAVAVSKDKQRPLIVSGSEDHTARVWDRLSGQKAVLLHPAAVRAVACSPVGSANNLCLTGADDGIARLWDLDNADPAKAVRELGSEEKVRHQTRIVSAAFAPLDGKTCVTADEKEIFLWDVDSGKLKYRFPSQHRGQISYVQYTPQAKLLSVARDHSLCMWRLGEKGAAPETVIDYRSGDVPVLGASPDGQSVLFDQDRALHVLSVADQRTEGVLPAPSDASQFAGFALFSPDGRMILAEGTADNPLQLWKAPVAGSRAHLIRRLAVGPASTPTCAAFSPDGAFAVTGTLDHKVLVWKLPTEAEIKQDLTGDLTFTSSSMDAADRKVRIWANVTNIGDSRLLAGDTVTLVIPPAESR
jgi:WD40 repeat protein/biotin carboxyl carrier protein